jgi:nitrite reductase/ring-hydroxylating ferredoxin subunit
LTKELHEIDPDLEVRALRAWNLLMMVILEMLSRAYTSEHDVELHGSAADIDHQAIFNLALETYELDLGMRRPTGTKEVLVGTVQEIPDGERKIIQVDDLSIGVFHHQGSWYAHRNSCLHRGGPVCTGSLEGDVLTCPWHGYQYNVTNGQLLVDPIAKLTSYPVQVRDGLVYLQVSMIQKEVVDLSITEKQAAPEEKEQPLKENEFYIRQVAPGQSKLIRVDAQAVAVYNVGGDFFATQEECTHARGPLSEGDLNGRVITCPLHGSRFDVTTGKVLAGPAREPLKTFRVTVESGIGRVESA